MEKQLHISLDEKGEWGPNETTYRGLMLYYGVPEEDIPYIDEESSYEEREYMFEQMVKEAKNYSALLGLKGVRVDPHMYDTSYQTEARAISVIVSVLVSMALLVVAFLIIHGG